MEWESFDLNKLLLGNLKSWFKEPTEIQEKVLVYASSKVDLVIQARTGEGKTWCYAIPITNYILNFYSRDETMNKKISPVALIIVPTRELGIQVRKHIEQVLYDKETKKNLFNIKIVDVLGGFAKQKQIKIWNKLNPEIIIATPGRWWEIIENEESPLLYELKHLKFLVVDEADRMTETGHFKELKNIIEHVYGRLEIQDNKKEIGDNGIKDKVKNFTGEGNWDDEEENIKLAKVLNVNAGDIETLDPIALMKDNVEFDEMKIDDEDYNEEEDNEDEEEQEQEQEEDEEEDEEGDKEIDEESDNTKDNKEINDEENEKEENVEENEDKEDNDEENEEEDKNIMDVNNYRRDKNKYQNQEIEYTTKVGLRTILCSATIDQIHKTDNKNQKGPKQKRQKQSNLSSEEEHFQKLIKNVKFYNKLIYLKLKNADNLIESDSQPGQKQKQSQNEETENSISILPSKLNLDCYKVDPTTKDYYLYYILRENWNSKIIIFTNSVSHTKKLFSIFSYFSEFKCSVLHSKMLQNARMKNLERFESSESMILFCTDIGARGLDIPYVDLIIHYHIPQKSEIFIHRSGRTARANRSGKVSSLITQKEIPLYKKIMIDLHYKQFSMKTLNLSQLEKIKSLFEFAKQIEKESFKMKKTNREKMWYEKSAQQLDMIYDEERGEEDNNESKMQEKWLNKKRKLLSKDKFTKKKIYTKLNESSIKRTSFLTPEQVNKLNKLMKDDSFKNENWTQALYEARNDARSIKFKEKPKRQRYRNRRKGK